MADGPQGVPRSDGWWTSASPPPLGEPGEPAQGILTSPFDVKEQLPPLWAPSWAISHYFRAPDICRLTGEVNELQLSSLFTTTAWCKAITAESPLIHLSITGSISPSLVNKTLTYLKSFSRGSNPNLERVTCMIFMRSQCEEDRKDRCRWEGFIHFAGICGHAEEKHIGRASRTLRLKCESLHRCLNTYRCLQHHAVTSG